MFTTVLHKMISFFLSLIFAVSASTGISFSLTLPAKVSLEEISQEDTMYTNGHVSFAYEKGAFSLAMNGVTMFTDAVTEYKQEKTVISSLSYDEYVIENETVSDARGDGTKITVTLKKESFPELKQIFTFYNNTDYFLLDTEISSQQGVATNYIAPMIVRNSKIQNGNPKWTNFLEVPFDNDGWVTFETKNICQDGLSHEVGAFFTPDAEDGLIIGSLTHDTWKSAVEYKTKLARINELYVYSGANTELTRDQSPHGTVSGECVSSATFFVGFYDNWITGMNEYAQINTTFTPKRNAVISSNPIGWNSWGSIQDKISYSNAIATSDYIKENFQNTWQDEGDVVYVNIDSFWDNLTDEELKDFVKHCEENGQVAGIYSSPFVMWWDEEGMKNNCVPGTDIRYNDIRLKKADGTYYGNDIDGCFPLDVTHPATLIHFKTQLERLMNCGFKYIKLDFLVHGSLEGDFYRDDIQTGIQAYNYAMNEVCNIVGDDVFINLSMAPIFPYNYANGRRLCCDTYSGINETKYMLNSLTYGFWQSELYDWIDPDHIIVWGKEGKASASEARSRMVSGVITGGSFLAGDNFVTPAKDEQKAFARYEELLTNEKLIEVLKIGKPFEAQLSAKCESSADVFTLENDGKTYVAVLNYSALPAIKKVALPAENCTVLNLFTGKTEQITGNEMSVTLRAKDSVIFEISK